MQVSFAYLIYHIINKKSIILIKKHILLIYKYIFDIMLMDTFEKYQMLFPFYILKLRKGDDIMTKRETSQFVIILLLLAIIILLVK